ncbi:hypothetical protein Tco_0347586 [Tanacetum coccineum]
MNYRFLDVVALSSLVVLVLQVVIGPATVGAIQAGAFKMGDTAGTIVNIIQCKMLRVKPTPDEVGLLLDITALFDVLPFREMRPPSVSPCPSASAQKKVHAKNKEKATLKDEEY